jgi:antitoxin (DNA-binding transcriptional repressor) of toxin-antitoxin stability system
MDSTETVHMSEDDVARDLHAVLDRVRSGAEVVIEQDHRPVAVLRSSGPRRPGRTLRECIALARDYEARLGQAPLPDADFAADVQSGVEGRRDPLESPRWD